MTTEQSLETIAGRLAWVRERAGLTKNGLSESAGLDRAVVRLVEAGERLDPQTSTTTRVSRKLGIEPGWLADGLGPLVAKRPELDPRDPEHEAAIVEYLRAFHAGTADVAVERAHAPAPSTRAAHERTSALHVDRSEEFAQVRPTLIPGVG